MICPSVTVIQKISSGPVQIVSAATGRYADFAFLPDFIVPSASKEKVSCSASSKTAALLPVISCRPITGDFAAALKIFSASFLLVITLKCFWIFSSSPSAPLIETASKRFKIDLNSIRFMNLNASGVYRLPIRASS